MEHAAGPADEATQGVAGGQGWGALTGGGSRTPPPGPPLSQTVKMEIQISNIPKIEETSDQIKMEIEILNKPMIEDLNSSMQEYYRELHNSMSDPEENAFDHCRINGNNAFSESAIQTVGRVDEHGINRSHGKPCAMEMQLKSVVVSDNGSAEVDTQCSSHHPAIICDVVVADSEQNERSLAEDADSSDTLSYDYNDETDTEENTFDHCRINENNPSSESAIQTIDSVYEHGINNSHGKPRVDVAMHIDSEIVSGNGSAGLQGSRDGSVDEHGINRSHGKLYARKMHLKSEIVLVSGNGRAEDYTPGSTDHSPVIFDVAGDSEQNDHSLADDVYDSSDTVSYDSSEHYNYDDQEKQFSLSEEEIDTNIPIDGALSETEQDTQISIDGALSEAEQDTEISIDEEFTGNECKGLNGIVDVFDQDVCTENEHPIVLHQCDMCDQLFTTDSILQMHIKTVHIKSVRLVLDKHVQCQVCGDAVGVEMFNSHMSSHILPKKSCEVGANADVQTKKAHFAFNSHLSPHILPEKSCEVGANADVQTKKAECVFNSHMYSHSQLKKSCEVGVSAKVQTKKAQFAFNSHMSSHSLPKKSCEVGANADVQTLEPQCAICDESFSKFEQLQTHITDAHTSDSAYRCAMCDNCYSTTVNELEQHINDYHHTDDLPFQCAICEKLFSEAKTLEKHMDEHKKGEDFICETCPHSFVRSDYLRVHIKMAHMGLSQRKCVTCGDIVSLQGFNDHVLSHNTEATASTCGTGDDLQNSMPSYNNGQQGIRIYNISSEAPPHQRRPKLNTISTNEKKKSFKSGKGDETVIQGKDHTKHTWKEIVNINCYQCKTCKMSFTRNDHLKKHVRQCHPLDNSFCNTSIPKPRIDAEPLYKHSHTTEVNSDKNSEVSNYKMNVNKKKVEDNSSCNTRKQKPKKNVCEICEKTFINNSSVKRHMLTCRKLFPRPNSLVCKLCDKIFHNRSNATRHMRKCRKSLHVKKETFVCELCEQTFSCSSSVRRHMRICRKARPPVRTKTVTCTGLNNTKHNTLKRCQLCDLVFPRASDLERHMTTQHIKSSLCTICGDIVNVDQHEIHVHNHEGKEFCKICNKIITGKDKIRLHEEMVHGDQEVFMCGICNVKCTCDTELNTHFKTEHPDGEYCRCRQCGQTVIETGLKKHMLAHDEVVAFQCGLCFQLLRTVASVSIHMKLLHLEDSCRKCTHCGNTVTLGMFNEHMLSHGEHALLAPSSDYPLRNLYADAKKSHQCETCHQLFCNYKHLKRHVVANTTDTVFVCGLCHAFFVSDKSLRRHAKGDHPGCVMCEICGGIIKTDDLKNHMLSHNPTNETYPEVNFCRVCNRQFFDTIDFKMHFNAEHPDMKDWMCRICGKSVEIMDVEEHVSMHYMGAWKHTKHCDVCGTFFCSGDEFEIHLRKHITGRLEHTRCSICGEQLTDQSEEGLTLHLKSHAKHDVATVLPSQRWRHKCDKCGKECLTLSGLKHHQKMHLNSRPNIKPTCEICGKTVNGLDEHIQIEHQGHRFKCDSCHQKFKSLYSLKQHLRIHTREKPYACGKCDKRFAQHSALYAHKRTHTGEKPYGCEVCELRFSQSYSLTRHMRTHTGQKPYECSECGDSFAQKGGLTSHIARHHKAKP